MQRLRQRFAGGLLCLMLGFPLIGLAESFPATEASQAPATWTYTRWRDLPAGDLRQAFETTGAGLINNLDIVALDQGMPALIRGGGFTQASLEWLILTQRVRTILDLRGRFPDDKTSQIIAHPASVAEAYRKRQEVYKIRNLSPREVQTHVTWLNQQHGLQVRYVQLRAEDPALVIYLDQARRDHPVAMFCQWGINRSGTAWGRYAARHGWPRELALQRFGVRREDGSYRNVRDIDYGYALEKRLKRSLN